MDRTNGRLVASIREPMRRPLLAPSLLVAAALTGAASPALAEGSVLHADLLAPKAIKLDGLPKEWPSALAPLSRTVKGKVGKADLEARAAIAYDNTTIYIAADVTDDVLRAGADHIALVIGFPGGASQELLLYPGDPGKSPGAAKTGDGKAIPGAKVIEAPRAGGYSLEASVPWSALPQATTVRIGLRAALFARDADGSTTIEGVVGSSTSSAYADLPALTMEPEQALSEGLLREKGLRGSPRYHFLADVAGDAMKERVLVYDRYLVVLGPTFRKGSEYYWSDLGVDVAGGMLPFMDVRDLTGDGQAELIVRKRVGSGSKWRELLQVMNFGKSEVPNVVFQHEVGISTDAGSVVNELAITEEGGKGVLKISTGTAKGLNAGNYKEATESAFDPLLLPWGTIKSQTYKHSGSAFVKVAEETQAPTAAPAAKGGAQVSAAASGPDTSFKPPPAPSAAELMDQVYDLYKKDRKVTGKARFDASVDVTGDKTPERVLLHGRDIVVFGKAFKRGTGYSTLTMQFASANDILGMTAKDLTGDGKAEIIVKGELHSAAPADAGGGTVDRQIVLVFQVNGDVIKRLFAAEIARSIGKNRIEGVFRLVEEGGLAVIQLAPGKAIEWTEKTYPYNQDTGPIAGVEPLLLPWGGAKPLRYKWNGSTFVR